MVSSLRTRLLTFIAVIQIVAATTAAFLVVHHERRRSYETLDASLREQAANIKSLIQPPDEDREAFILHKEFLMLPSNVLFKLVESNGRSLGQSERWVGTEALKAGIEGLQTFARGTTRYRGVVIRNLFVFNDEPKIGMPTPQLTLIVAVSTAEIEAHIRNVALRAALLCLLLLLISTAASAWAITWSLQPLHHLAASASLVDTGHWQFVPPHDTDVTELKPLANALSLLVERLKVAFRRERQFFGDCAHEMKTCIAIIQSTLQLNLQVSRSAAQYRHGVFQALEDTRRLQRLITDMLDLVTIEDLSTDVALLQGDPTEANAVAEEVLQLLSSVARKKSVALHLQSSGKEQWVRMRENDFASVLTKLIENAITYSDAGQEIIVRILEGKDETVVVVEDEGCGISAEALPFIFERFYRSDDSRSRATGGNGLGLSIVRAIIGSARGSVSATSILGKGSMFTVHIPLG